jgi:hypothetical protein
MERKQVPGPEPDGEESNSSPSSFSGKGRNDGPPVRPGAAAGFADGGAADVMAPGANLARLVTTVTGTNGSVLRTLTDQEVLGVLGAVQRIAAWAAWGELVTLAEFTRRHPAASNGSVTARAAAEEAAWKTGESWARMLDQAEHAVAVNGRLPQTLAAMRQGRLSAYKMRIIEGQTADLTAEDVAKADVMLAAAGQVKNPAALRDFARRQVARLDPDAAVRRKERGRRDAYVRIYQEDSGNMGLSAREMPNRDGQIAWQNIEARALDLHAAGVPGTIGQLQVQAMLDFLLGRATPGQDSARQDGAHQDGAHQDSARQDSAHQDGDRYACSGAHADDGGDVEGEDAGSYEQNARASARRDARGGGRSGWAVNPILIVPWDPSLGRPSGPAELPGYGMLDQDDTMDLLEAAGHDPASRWCMTATGRDGTAAAHGCLPGQRTLDAIIAAGLATSDALDLAAALNISLRPIAKGACDHAHAEPGYRPSRKLRHLVMARNTRCTAWGCGRPAAACDQDHTLAWDDGGITCECGLAPLCRHHHQIKQAQGWKLEQPEPGVLVWTTPSGLTRTTRPTSYQ